MLFLGFIALIQVALSTTLTSAHPYLKGCGEYIAKGELDCSGEHCALKVFKGSQAETELRIDSNDPVFEYFSKKNVSIRIELKSLTHAQPLGLPERALPEMNFRDLILVKAFPCLKK